MKVVRGAVEDLSGVIARSKDLWRGYSQPGTHVGERRPSGLSSMQHENTGHARLGHANELLRGFRRVYREGKRD